VNVIGFVRLSPSGNGKGKGSAHSLDSQWASIAQWCKANNHELVTVVAEVGSAKSYDKLQGRRLAIAAVKAGMGAALVVRDLDRVTRSTLDGADLLEDAKVNEWRLMGAVDQLDTDDEEQEFTINVRIAVAQEERRKLARRTRDGLATARRNGSQVGKPRQVPPEVEARIVRLAKKGTSPYRIAQRLTDEQVPTPQGGKAWSPSVVRDVIARNTKPATRNGAA
jgi:DNA invertase Pin-like site-specific DNA recombinase